MDDYDNTYGDGPQEPPREVEHMMDEEMVAYLMELVAQDVSTTLERYNEVRACLMDAMVAS